jgi:hypothetical protein
MTSVITTAAAHELPPAAAIDNSMRSSPRPANKGVSLNCTADRDLMVNVTVMVTIGDVPMVAFSQPQV